MKRVIVIRPVMSADRSARTIVFPIAMGMAVILVVAANVIGHLRRYRGGGRLGHGTMGQEDDERGHEQREGDREGNHAAGRGPRARSGGGGASCPRSAFA